MTGPRTGMPPPRLAPPFTVCAGSNQSQRKIDVKVPLSKIVMTLSALALLLAPGMHCRAQEGGERAYALGRLVEFTSEDGARRRTSTWCR